MKKIFLKFCNLIELAFKYMSTIKINNSTYSGNNITIIKNRVYVDDILVDTQQDRIINITVEGDIETIKSGAGDITIKGNVKNSVETGAGNIDIGGDVGGNVSSGAGNIKCNNITGNVKTGVGDIRYKK